MHKANREAYPRRPAAGIIAKDGYGIGLVNINSTNKGLSKFLYNSEESGGKRN